MADDPTMPRNHSGLLPRSPLHRYLRLFEGEGGAGGGSGGGGAGDGSEGAPAGGTETDASTTDDGELGDAGQATLKKLRADLKAARDEAKRLKPLADEATRIQDEQKTEAQRATEALAAAERERDEARAAALRLEVANAKGVPANLLPGGTKEEIEAAADALLEFAGEKGGPRSPAPIRDQGAGGSRNGKSSPRDEFAGFLGRQLGAPQS